MPFYSNKEKIFGLIPQNGFFIITLKNSLILLLRYAVKILNFYLRLVIFNSYNKHLNDDTIF